MADFLNDAVVFEGEVFTHGELITQGGLTIGPGGLRVGQPSDEGANSWPAHLRARVANVAERNALTAWRIANAPISPLQPLAVWRADGSSTGVEEVTIDGINWYAESAAAGDVELTISTVASYGWVLMQGQTIVNAATLYPALWAAAATSLRVGSTDLRIPDMRGRGAMGAGQGPALSLRNLGDLVGTETATISQQQLPAHTHSGTTGGADRSLNHDHYFRLSHVAGVNPAGSTVDFETHNPSSGGIHRTSFVSDTSDADTGPSLNHLHTFTTGNGPGQGQGHANMQPTTVLNYKLKV